MFPIIIAYLLIASQLDSILCSPVPQNQNFNGSNPYYDRYNNQHWGDNSFSNVNPYNPYTTTPKPLYPSLYPQTAPTSPPYYGQGQYNGAPQSGIKGHPSNTFGGNNNTYGWNSNVNTHTTGISYQPYEQIVTTTRPPVTTFPPYNPNGSFNNNRNNPTLPNRRPQPTMIPTYTPWNRNMNVTNNNNTFVNRNSNKNTTSHQYPYPSRNTSFQSYPIGQYQGTKNTNLFGNNNNFNADNSQNSLYPSLVPQGNNLNSKPNYDQEGTPLASYGTNDKLFNYDNLHRRRPINGIESSAYENVPLAPFPGSRGMNYGIDSSQNVPLAPFPRGSNYGIDSNPNVPLAPFSRKG